LPEFCLTKAKQATLCQRKPTADTDIIILDTYDQMEEILKVA